MERFGRRGPGDLAPRLGLTAFTIALVVLIWTRWGQYRPLQKCLVLSLSAHLLLAGYATTVKIVGMNPARQDGTLQISLFDGPGGAGGDDAQPPPAVEKTPLPLLEISGPTTPPLQVAKAVLDKPVCPPADSPKSPEPPKSIEPPKPVGMTEDAAATAAGSADRVPAASPQPPSDPRRPVRRAPRPRCRPSYRLRLAPDRATLAQGRGGSAESESAVQAALCWLARNQSPDGHWSVRQHEGGRAASADGRTVTPASRRTAPSPAWPCWRFSPRARRIATASHKDEVRRGLEYLLSVQADDGNLAGRADLFARMYSHAMAAFALSEAYGMTGDVRLRDGGPAGGGLHRRRAGPLRRRLAISARRSRRHQPTRLAIDGAEKRGTCRHPHSRADAAGDRPFSAERRRGQAAAGWPRIAPANGPAAR